MRRKASQVVHQEASCGQPDKRAGLCGLWETIPLEQGQRRDGASERDMQGCAAVPEGDEREWANPEKPGWDAKRPESTYCVLGNSKDTQQHLGAHEKPGHLDLTRRSLQKLSASRQADQQQQAI